MSATPTTVKEELKDSQNNSGSASSKSSTPEKLSAPASQPVRTKQDKINSNLFAAVQQHDHELFEKTLNQRPGPDINAYPVIGSTGKQFTGTVIHEAIMWYNRPAIKKLLVNNALLNIESIAGNLPIHLAVKKGDDEVVRELMVKGANLTFRHSGGHTALHEVMRDVSPFSVISFTKWHSDDNESNIIAKSLLDWFWNKEGAIKPLPPSKGLYHGNSEMLKLVLGALGTQGIFIANRRDVTPLMMAQEPGKYDTFYTLSTGQRIALYQDSYNEEIPYSLAKDKKDNTVVVFKNFKIYNCTKTDFIVVEKLTFNYASFRRELEKRAKDSVAPTFLVEEVKQLAETAEHRHQVTQFHQYHNEVRFGDLNARTNNLNGHVTNLYGQVGTLHAEVIDVRERVELHFPFEREKLALLNRHPQLANFMDSHTKKMLATMDVFVVLSTGYLKVDKDSSKLGLAAMLIEKVGQALVPPPFDKIFAIVSAGMDKLDDHLMKTRVKKVFEIIPVDSNALAMRVSYRITAWVAEQFSRFGNINQLDQEDLNKLCNVVCAIAIHSIYNANKLEYPAKDLIRYKLFEDYLVSEVQDSKDFSNYLNKTAEKLIKKGNPVAVTPLYSVQKDKVYADKSESQNTAKKGCCTIM